MFAGSIAVHHTSFTTVNTTYNGSTTGTFGTVTAAADPRILEFAAKIHFSCYQRVLPRVPSNVGG